MTILSDSAPTVPTFDSLYPKILAQFRYYARRFSRCKTLDRDDVIQDLMGIALEMYTSQVRRGREVYYTPLVRYAIKRFRDGRRFTGQNTTDILSENTQMKGRSKVRLFSEYESKPGSWGFEHYNRQPGVAEGVQSKIDYEDWVAQQAERDQQIITDLSMGETTNNVAKKYRVSAGLISQYRKRYRKSWDDFMGDTHKPA
jgi:hypothetical protein